MLDFAVDFQNVNLENLAPYLGQLSFGALAGFMAGYALKKVGKVVAIILGLLFITLQLLAYFDMITINWLAVQNRVDPMLESEALNSGWRRLLDILTHQFVAAAAFIPAFILGLQRG
jgi:uncharacterized membrane protein (Fun14 family)